MFSLSKDYVQNTQFEKLEQHFPNVQKEHDQN